MPSLTRRTVSANDTHAFLRHHQPRTVSWHGPQAKRRLDIFWAANWVHPWRWRGWINLKTDRSHSESLIIFHGLQPSQEMGEKKKSERTNECIQTSPCNIISIQGRLTWLLLMDLNPNEGKAGNLSEELITVKGEPKMLVGLWVPELLGCCDDMATHYLAPQLSLKPTQWYTSFLFQGQLNWAFMVGSTKQFNSKWIK